MACGENPKNVFGRRDPPETPTSRMGVGYLFREAFENAARDQASLKAWNCNPSGLFAFSLRRKFVFYS